ncbi:transcriptional regulator, MarR family [Cellulomonas flavigena DSM 20109]|uniref:Transcriptional regulator, MarR family n=1 Tax=Cellulomonas flavigena (strain ATCC 482 / DSM 20109 / BCRC 11376 / JCM 18109 / NBRC 3775 / NCIMB 8073 / NRS 134) TaxID=446466 RepID=D5ULI6_CELFN|nr:MarR family transcriptional regulator [Cellulomonas flavigena]ADG74028.1 transcriptional regulator, MarR family [Cellulomonas flavigena DSM 20109]
MTTDADRSLAGDLTVTLHHLVDVVAEYADDVLTRRHGVTFSQYVFLHVLADLDHPDVTSLARCLRVTKAAVSKRVGGFVDAGWVRTLDDPSHGRRVLLELTDTGRRLVDHARADLEEDLAAAYGATPGVDPRTLHGDLTTLLDSMRAALGTRVPGSPLV